VVAMFAVCACLVARKILSRAPTARGCIWMQRQRFPDPLKDPNQSVMLSCSRARVRTMFGSGLFFSCLQSIVARSLFYVRGAIHNVETSVCLHSGAVSCGTRTSMQLRPLQSQMPPGEWMLQGCTQIAGNGRCRSANTVMKTFPSGPGDCCWNRCSHWHHTRSTGPQLRSCLQ
jgi:hypothetical protein